ncbi:MAG: hypothetical protein AB1540_05990 [Bdellovibrionota bacterium]
MARKSCVRVCLLVSSLLFSASFFASCEAAKRQNDHGLSTGHGATTTSKQHSTEDTLWVGKSDNAKSCGPEKGISIDIPAQELKTAQIPILAKQKLHDGQMRIQMCGADKGDFNGFLIPKAELEKAKSLGFSVVPAPPSAH